MRLSCNGCRVLRKGCTEACTIRPCLQWIKAPDAQANATVFLAKFYGRAGLLNLIDAAPSDELRPAVFRSLLYEACGRIVNPVYGSVGLLWSGSWHLCQAAVEAVLKGSPIVQISPDQAVAPGPAHLHKAASAAACYDIRHVAGKAKPAAGAGAGADAAADAPAASSSPADDAQSSKAGGGGSVLLHKVAKPGRTRFKRASTSPSSKRQASSKPSDTEDNDEQHGQVMADRASSEDDTHHQEASAASMDTDAEAASHVSQAEQATAAEEEDHLQEQQHPGLDLTLGFGLFAPVAAAARPPTPPGDAGCSSRGGWSAAAAEEPGVVGFQFL
ncbi:unnamed protein product [Urochloa humidicola]